MIQTVLLLLLAMIGGASMSTQASANAGLAARIGLGSALLVSTTIVFLFTIGFWLWRGAATTFFPPNTPKVLYVGGLCGFLIISTLAYAFPRLGGAQTVALVVLGQGLAALAIDHFGLLDMPRDPATLRRCGGVLLIALGAFLSR